MSIPGDQQPAGSSDDARAAKDREPSAPARRISLGRVVTAAVAMLLLAALFVTGEFWIPTGILYPARTEVPRGLSWLPFGTTRLEFLEILASEGNTWECVVKPGMTPTAWASFTNPAIRGHVVPQLATLFSDGQRYDYGAIPKETGERLVPARLLGDNSPDAKIVGIRWKVPQSSWQIQSGNVPIAVLRELGQPHSQEQDITGIGRNVSWKWPAVEAYYYENGGTLVMMLTEEAARVNQSAGPGNMPGIARPAGGAGPASRFATQATPADGGRTSSGDERSTEPESKVHGR
jgi:hypothetical protein